LIDAVAEHIGTRAEGDEQFPAVATIPQQSTDLRERGKVLGSGLDAQQGTPGGVGIFVPQKKGQSFNISEGRG